MVIPPVMVAWRSRCARPIRRWSPVDGPRAGQVQGYGVVRAVDFANDVEPILSKFVAIAAAVTEGIRPERLQAVADGSRHGARLRRAGQAGHGRRVFPAAPDRSLLLTKPTGQCVHGGGRRFDVDSQAIGCCGVGSSKDAAGGKPDSPTVVRIEAVPPSGSCTVSRISNCGSWPRSPTAPRKTSRPKRNTQPAARPGDGRRRRSSHDARHVGEGTVMVRYGEWSRSPG